MAIARLATLLCMTVITVNSLEVILHSNLQSSHQLYDRLMDMAEVYGGENGWLKKYMEEALPVSGDTSDANRNFKEICVNAGFHFEQHQVITDDGYILAVYRIPGKLGDRTKGKPPVFLQHGVFDSAYGWIMNYVESSPAFILAEQGYDVWLGNSRGNTYSRKHIELDPDNDAKDFWAFDW